MIIRSCLFLHGSTHEALLENYLPKLQALCPDILLNDPLPRALASSLPLQHTDISLNIPPTMPQGQALFIAAAKAKEWGCTHLIHVELKEDAPQLLENLQCMLKRITQNPQALVISIRNFSQASPWRMRFERVMSSFWLRVQTGAKVPDVHSSLRAYPLDFFDFVNIQEKGYAFDAEVLARALWADYPLELIPCHMPSPHTWQGPTLKDYLKLITLNVRLTMRALMPLPFKRRNATRQEPISLKQPLKSLRRLMDDPYNRANPKELARTATIAMAVLTVPAPIIQSVALLLCIGLFRLNRLCALAMIPFTWPPFLPAMAILIGYRVRHGHWLTEFSMQTLGYEAGQRLWEWVIGSLILTPIFALTAGCVVGALAHLVARKPAR